MKHILLIAFAAGGLFAADATGTWKGTLTPASGQGGPAHLVLKQDGDKLTGTGGPGANEQHAIQNGKAEGGKLTFDLPSPNVVMKFTLVQEGDQIKGDITRERDGQTQTAKLDVKREKQP